MPVRSLAREPGSGGRRGCGGAGLAGATFDDRRVALRVARLAQVDPEAAAPGSGPARCRGAPSRVGIAQSNRSMPIPIPTSRSSTSPIPSRCRGASTGSSGIVNARTPCISSLSRPRVPPIAIPSIAAAAIPSADSRRRSSWIPPWTMPKTAWPRRALLAVPVEAAAEPAMGALRRARGVVAVGVEGRALVEDQRDVGAELPPGPPSSPRARGSARSRRGRSGSAPPPRRSPTTALPPRPAPPALDLVGDAAVGEREDLEAAGVGDDRPLPAHEAVQAAELRRSAPRPGETRGGRCCRAPSRSRARRPRPPIAHGHCPWSRAG